MGRLSIYGGKPLKGQIEIQGSKNAVLPILAATLLAQEPCEIKNCPDLTDVRAAFSILENLGAKITYDGTTAWVDPTEASGSVIPDDLMRQMRSSVMFLGAILGRCGRACISYPGGCELGARPIDIHLRSLSRMGIEIKEDGGYIRCLTRRYIPQTITFMFPSVGATENVMMLSAVSPGETILVNPAREPEIVDLQNFLNAMGADILGAGSDCIRIRGVRRLHGCSYSVIPDRIVTATYACAAVSCGGEISLTRTEPGHLRIFLSVLRDMGVQVREADETLWIKSQGRPAAVSLIKTLPYPGFPTDIQPLLMAALLKARGSTLFNETIFESRFKHAGEFLRLGAEIQIEGMNAIVHGVSHLHGAELTASDLRGGASLVIAALGADGKSGITDADYIKRGYVSIVEDLQRLGGDIQWTKE